MNARQVSFFIAFAVLCIAMNVLWYRVKFLLRARGFPVAWFYRQHFRDLSHLAQLSETETSLEQRQRFRRLRSSIIVLLVASLICFSIFFAFGVIRTFAPH